MSTSLVPYRPPPPAALPQARWARIQLLATDVDGVLTDGGIQVSSTGVESKTFNVLDGLGMVRLLREGIPVAWISGRLSAATTVRATELKIPHLIQARVDKANALGELAASLGLPAEACAYIGDDDIDAGALAWAGIGISVPDAIPAAWAAADCVTVRRGGFGAVREVCEQILAARGLERIP